MNAHGRKGSEGWVQHRLGTLVLDVSWTVDPGEILCLFGPSGSGKSTTLRTIAGLLRPDEGYIVAGDQEVFDSTTSKWVPPHHRQIGYLPQEYVLFPHLTAAKNVAFGLGSLSRIEREHRVTELLAVMRVDDVSQHYPVQMSVGQQQRVSLARALAPWPCLLLLDEPFSALDDNLRVELRRELKGIARESNMAMILVTHDWDDVIVLSDRVLELGKGSVVNKGTSDDLLDRRTNRGVSRVTEVDNVFVGSVAGIDELAGVMMCDIGGIAMEIPYGDFQVGGVVRVGIRAGDIVVASKYPESLSARNILQGTVVSVEARGFEMELLVDCGQPFRVQLTPKAVDSLGLTEGQTVWLVIKSNSCFVIE